MAEERIETIYLEEEVLILLNLYRSDRFYSSPHAFKLWDEVENDGEDFLVEGEALEFLLKREVEEEWRMAWKIQSDIIKDAERFELENM